MDNSEINNQQAPNTDNPETKDTAMLDLQTKNDRLKQQADGSYQEASKNFDIIADFVGKDNKLLESITDVKLAERLTEKLGIKSEELESEDDGFYDKDELFAEWEKRQESKKSEKSFNDILSIYSDEDRKTIEEEYKETVGDKVINNARMKNLVNMIATSLNKEAIRENALADMASGNISGAGIPITKAGTAKTREDLSPETLAFAKEIGFKI